METALSNLKPAFEHKISVWFSTTCVALQCFLPETIRTLGKYWRIYHLKLPLHSPESLGTVSWQSSYSTCWFSLTHLSKPPPCFTTEAMQSTRYSSHYTHLAWVLKALKISFILHSPWKFAYIDNTCGWTSICLGNLRRSINAQHYIGTSAVLLVCTDLIYLGSIS